MKRPVLLSLISLLLSTTLFAQLPIVNGWTQFTPSPDTRLIYVSDSDGNDGTATFYNPNDVEIGTDPFQPTGTINAYQSINAALNQMRDGFPDWILLKKGDVFENQSFGVLFLGGRNENEPMLFGAYGTVGDGRPQVLTGGGEAMHFHGNAMSDHIAIVGIHLEAHNRQPSDDPNGITLFASFDDFLIEDCVITNFFDNLVTHDLGNAGEYRQNLKVRRSIITDAYTVNSGHANAMFISDVDGILFEENLLDHNGWSETVAGADPTPFRHNSYFHPDNSGLIFRGNIVARGAATGGGHRGGGIIDNNLYLSNVQNIQFGTHETTIPDAASYVTGEVKNNVVLGARVEDFDNGRGLSIAKAQNADIYHNIIAHFFGTSNYPSAIRIHEGFNNLDIFENIIYNWGNNQVPSTNNQFATSRGIAILGTAMGNTTIRDNQIQHNNDGGTCIDNSAGFSNVSFEGQTYHSEVESNRWFAQNGAIQSYQDWLNQSGEVGSQAEAINYTDPQRLMPQYMSLLGETGDLAEFCDLVRQQSKDNWNDNLTAATINCWVRAGFQTPITFDYNESVSISSGETATLNLSNLSTNDFSISFDGQPFVTQTSFEVSPTETTIYQVELIDHHQEWLMCEPLQFEFEVIVESGPLSVNVISDLKVENKESSVQLDWKGLANATAFEIERAEDGWHFYPIASVSNAIFSYNDKQPLDGQNYYRIKNVLPDGTYQYSNIESILYKNDIQVFPNPVQDRLYVKGLDISGKIIKLEVRDALGRLFVESDTGQLPLSLKTLPDGLYFLKIEGKQRLMKFVKK